MYLPVSVAMAGCSEGGTVSGRARALNESNPAHSNLAPNVAATLMPLPRHFQTNILSLLLILLFDPLALLSSQI